MSQSMASVINWIRLCCAAIVFAPVFSFAPSVDAQQSKGGQTATPNVSPKTAHDERHEQWDVLEVSLPGPTSGNPFVDVQLTATFQHENNQRKVNGFYDGDGIYRVRFMPDKIG